MTDKEKLKNGIKESLKNGKYEELFFEDLFHLWKVDGISPEVVLRELRAIEGALLHKSAIGQGIPNPK